MTTATATLSHEVDALQVVTANTERTIGFLNFLRGMSLVIPGLGALAAVVCGEPGVAFAAGAVSAAVLIGTKLASIYKKRAVQVEIQSLIENGSLSAWEADQLKTLSNRLTAGIPSVAFSAASFGK